jgi:hypothetical protein
MLGIGVTAAMAAKKRRCSGNTNGARILALLLAEDADVIRMMMWSVNVTRRQSTTATETCPMTACCRSEGGRRRVFLLFSVAEAVWQARPVTGPGKVGYGQVSYFSFFLLLSFSYFFVCFEYQV